MGLRMKILSGFLILATMLCLAGVWSIYELNSIGGSVQRLLNDNYKSINAAKDMIEAIEREDSGVLVLLLGRWEEGRDIIKSAEDQFRRALETAGGNITIKGEKEHVDEIESKYVVYSKLVAKPIVGTTHEGNLDWYFNKVHMAFLDVKTSLERFMAMNDQTMYETATDLKNRARRAVMPGVIAILSSLVFTLIFNYFINYYIISPILRMTDGIDKLLNKGTPFKLKIESRDELFKLADSIEKLSSEIQLNRESV